MLISIYFPFSDFRAFLVDGFARLEHPSWPWPGAGGHVRGFGNVIQRPKGGFEGWVGEQWLATGGSAISLCLPRAKSSVGLSKIRLVRKACYFDGLFNGRVEFLFDVEAADYTRETVLAAAGHLLETPTRISRYNYKGPLENISNFIGRIWADATVKHPTEDKSETSSLGGHEAERRSRVHEELVRTGRPICIIESEFPLKTFHEAKDISEVPSVELALMRRSRLTEVLIICPSTKTVQASFRLQSRTIRTYILRLLQDVEGLSLFCSLKFRESPVVDQDALDDRIQNALNEYTRQINRSRQRIGDYSLPKLIYYCYSAFSRIYPGRFDSLRIRLQNAKIRPQVIRKVLTLIDISETSNITVKGDFNIEKETIMGDKYQNIEISKSPGAAVGPGAKGSGTFSEVKATVMPTNYLILRVAQPVDSSFDQFNARAWQETPKQSITIQTVAGHEIDEGSLRSDPLNILVTDADTGFELIKPKSKGEGDKGILKQAGMLKMPPGLLAIGAHTTPFTGQGITVAILDTGIDDTHPAFAGKTIVKKNFTGGDEQDVRDSDGHGTHCAATICGSPVGDIRVGVAPGVTRLCVGKVVGPRGCTLEMLIRGLIWAVVEQKANIVSMSLGFDLHDNRKRLVEKGVKETEVDNTILRQHAQALKSIDTLKAFFESLSPNVILVAATGNESDRPNGKIQDADLPATEMLGVGAVGFTDGSWDVAPWSNGQPALVAPGVGVFSAAPGAGWVEMSGTSMATPHVAGVAALLAEKFRNEGQLNVPAKVRSALLAMASTTPLLKTQDFNAVGAGMIQAPQ